MADDQATLGSFADSADASEGGESPGESHDGGRGDGSEEGDGAAETPADDRAAVCPWCLADADRFVETGPTGLACGRCSAVLPVDADWFDAREVVARRPMYDADE